ncbi:16S rRNA (guanine(966)-N(2))-methyltransferase RsmD [Polymorphobacter megasporae]|uniref:16S rRNA (guanine(966)-N(2))-methyltransferase RsmD n=1 Tax=Glacieibacterium megasporae TaxID=2835787 RepID=UPI001C1DECA7|nr:16S rRNA (guanine(966)-N(2))-methyltransferase RsmD [Polymorphobacter megasporae]UAJ09696.1 16S rRNA (guanine(966)-N(2))-methyltransferase RsmD [Polymorphobacter megasporae]
MRIIAGQYRGRPLVAPPGEATRPTSERAREALFSMLASRLGDFDGLRVADLYAGTGALGLEALSRGAAHATFVENDKAAVTALRANILKCGADAATTVLQQPVQAIGRAPAAFDLILLDPPYGEGHALPALARLLEYGWVAPHAWVSVETAKGEALEPPGFTLDTVRAHGKARLHLFRAD